MSLDTIEQDYKLERFLKEPFVRIKILDVPSQCFLCNTITKYIFAMSEKATINDVHNIIREKVGYREPLKLNLSGYVLSKDTIIKNLDLEKRILLLGFDNCNGKVVHKCFNKEQSSSETEILAYQEEDECCFCLDDVAVVVLQPCKHKCLCEECYKKIKDKKCPLCRQFFN